MSDKFYVGLDLTGFENNGTLRPVSRVTLLLDDDNVLTAGDDTGMELTANCPHATQTMVNALLTQLKGKVYRMYSASDTRLDPSAELGDGITAGGMYSMISRLADDGSGFPSPSAPGKEELEDEFPAGGPMTQFFNRKISETRSSIRKTAEQIRLEVIRIDDDITTLESSFNVELGKIYSEIVDINGDFAKFEQTLNGFTLSVKNGEESSTIQLLSNGTVISSQNIEMNGLVTFKGLSDGTTTINGGCLKTGTIESMKIDGGEITGTSIKGAAISGGTITGTAIVGGSIKSEAVSGGATASILLSKGNLSFYYGNQGQGRISTSALNSGVNLITSQNGFRLAWANDIETDEWVGNIMFSITSAEAYFNTNSNELLDCLNNINLGKYEILHTSDARLKTNIKRSERSGLEVIEAIRTYSFDWKKSGEHVPVGFLAQQLGQVSGEFVHVHPSDGHYSTKDAKIIPYLVKAVQELSAEIETLKGGGKHGKSA